MLSYTCTTHRIVVSVSIIRMSVSIRQEIRKRLDNGGVRMDHVTHNGWGDHQLSALMTAGSQYQLHPRHTDSTREVTWWHILIYF